MDGGCPAPDTREREQPWSSPWTPARQVGKTNQVESTWPNFGQLEQVAFNLESIIQVVLNRMLTSYLRLVCKPPTKYVWHPITMKWQQFLIGCCHFRDSIGMDVPPVSLWNVPVIAEWNVPSVTVWNVPGVSLWYVPSVSLSNVPHAAVEPVPVEGGVRRVAYSAQRVPGVAEYTVPG